MPHLPRNVERCSRIKRYLELRQGALSSESAASGGMILSAGTSQYAERTSSGPELGVLIVQGVSWLVKALYVRLASA